VWHTHLKKRLEPKPSSGREAAAPKRKATKKAAAVAVAIDVPTTVPVSPEQSLSTTTTSAATTEEYSYSMASSADHNTTDSFTSEEEFQIDDSFWSETLAMTVDSTDSGMEMSGGDPLGAGGASPSSSNDDDMDDFWLKLFIQAGGMQNLPQI
jgi:myb proto-oncogene protein